MRTLTGALLLSVCSSSSACTGNETTSASSPAEPPVATAPVGPAKTEVAQASATATPTTSSDVATAAKPIASETTTTTQPEPEPELEPSAPAVAPIVSATTTTPSWTEIRAFDASVVVHPTDLGIVIGVGDTGHIVDATGVLAADDAVLGTSPKMLESASTVVGDFPADAWRIAVAEVDRSEVQAMFFKWRGNRWVAQPFVAPGATATTKKLLHEYGEFVFRKSPRSGMLVARRDENGLQVARVAGKHPDPSAESMPGTGYPEDLYETRAGSLVALVDDVIHVGCEYQQRNCTRATTVAIPTPFDPYHGDDGASWTAVGRHGFARVLQNDRVEAASALLVHDGKRATIATLPEERPATRVLGTASGDIWVATTGTGTERLLHRDSAGTWTTVAVPDALADTRLTLGLRDADHLWVVGTLGQRSTVFETTTTRSPVEAPQPG